MSGKRIRVAIIDNSIDPLLYKPVDHWKKYLAVPWESFRAKAGSLPDLAGGEFTHLIITGSEASILEREPWVMKEADLIREADERGMSILGSCYGHQLLALALLGPKHVGRCARPEIGWIPVRVCVPGDILGPEGEAYAFSAHFDEVLALEDPCIVLASTEICPVQAFRIKGKPVWGLQIHPEIDEGEARALLEAMVRKDLAAGPLFKAALASEPRDSFLIRGIVRHFLTGQ